MRILPQKFFCFFYSQCTTTADFAIERSMALQPYQLESEQLERSLEQQQTQMHAVDAWVQVTEKLVVIAVFSVATSTPVREDAVPAIHYNLP